jgi:hypothetical protein
VGVRWDDERREFPPLAPWQYALIGFVVGFAVCLLMFVVK